MMDRQMTGLTPRHVSRHKIRKDDGQKNDGTDTKTRKLTRRW